MRRRHLLLAFLLAAAFAVSGNAQPSPPPPSPLNDGNNLNPSALNRTISTIVTVLISAFFFILFFCFYVNQCRIADARYRHGGGGGWGGGGGSSRLRRGLDPAVVETFPIMAYKEIKEHKIGNGALECAVCLTEFEDGDDLRLLPQCSHVFHPDCIGPWLAAHVTCPLCRANLDAPAPPPPPPPPAETESATVQLGDDEEMKEEAAELERLRSARRAARMPRSHSTGHSLGALTSAPAAAVVGGRDHERFTLRLPERVRREVDAARRLRHASSFAGEGSSRGGGSRLGKWPSFLPRATSSSRGEGSARGRPLASTTAP